MLEAALQQMDGLISSTATQAGSAAGVGVGAGASLTLSERNLISATNVLSTAKTLALALQQVSHGEDNAQVRPGSLTFIHMYFLL